MFARYGHKFRASKSLVYGRRSDLKVLLHFELQRWGAVDFFVIVNECQVLALLVGVGSLHRKWSVRAGVDK